MKKLMMVVMAVVAVMACNNGMNNSARGMSEKGENSRVDRSRRTVMDAAKYVDFTVAKNNAAKFTKQDLMFDLNGTYRIAGGNSYITIDRAEGTLKLSSDDAWYRDSGGHNMYAKFSFDVAAANENCLYLRIGSKNRAQLVMDRETMANQAVPDLLMCVPLYGYSRSRIEVSPVMDGYIAMPSGTYWAVKGNE
jgi:hypothetical protein